MKLFVILISWTLLFSVCHTASANDQTHILNPIESSSSQTEKVLIIIPGGLVPNHHYLALGKQIQKVVPFKLWVGIVSCKWTAKLCNPLDRGPLGVNSLVSSLFEKISKMANKNFSQEDLFLAGHSLGGQGAFHFADNSETIGGVMLWGSTTNKDLSSYHYPILTLGGELDGKSTRIPRLAQHFSQFQNLMDSNGKEWALINRPVIILPDLNHSDFSPGFFVKGDLQSEVTTEQAVETIALVNGSFLTLHSGETQPNHQEALEHLQQQYQASQKLFNPFIKAREMEQNGQWCALMQKHLAQLDSHHDIKYQINIETPDSLTSFMNGHTKIELTQDNILKLTIISLPHYPSDHFDLSLSITSKQISCKLISKAKIDQVLGLSSQEEEGQGSCRVLNKKALDYALNAVSFDVYNRYQSKGLKIIFEEDISTSIGPQFIFLSKLKFKVEKDSLKIASPKLYTSLNSSIYPGNHYCKLLSPSKALEWISVDSFF